MDFGLSKDQELFRESYKRFLEKENPITLVREIEKNETDYSREIYGKMAELGWLQLRLPERYGGMGGNWVDMAILYEEMGRALLQGPHFTSIALCAEAILRFGTEDQRLAFLPRIANGEVIMTLALTERNAGSDLKAMTTRASPAGGDYVIDGEKTYISNAHLADYIIVVTRTAPSSAVPDSAEGSGLILFIVDGKDPNLRCRPMNTFGLGRVDEVSFRQVRIPKNAILGELNHGQDIIDLVNNAKLMLCAEAMGGAQKALEISIDYSKLRYQFGVPIGSFQALQHKMSDMALMINGSRWFCYYSAWLLSQKTPCTKEVAMTKLCAGETYRMVTAETIQILGGYGAMQAHDIGLYFRRAKAIQLSLGRNHTLKEAIVSSMGI
jgi:alkylation response protein AidB-like acyl-CoA dehydrogenase